MGLRRRLQRSAVIILLGAFAFLRTEARCEFETTRLRTAKGGEAARRLSRQCCHFFSGSLDPCIKVFG
jgi:hypothetical protein